MATATEITFSPMAFPGLFEDSDHVTCCHASVSLYEPFNPGVSTTTNETAGSPVASPGLSQC